LEAPRITACLSYVTALGADEVLVVDGCSSDGTDTIALNLGAKVHVSPLGSLSRDRQRGCYLTTYPLIAYFDADHRPPPDALRSLIAEMDEMGLDGIQASIRIVPLSFWNRAESEFLALTMVPGFHQMVGVAPTIFRREVLEKVRFADGLSIDDTDYFYRLTRDTAFRIAVGTTFIECRHDPRLRDYLAKFRWYGIGDGQFMASHPERRRSMLFHLLVRYPLIHPLRAVLTGKFRAAPYAIVQGLTRFRYSLTH
jgi:glycosyltransferase involved in cell wall biosynthesis